MLRACVALLALVGPCGSAVAPAEAVLVYQRPVTGEIVAARDDGSQPRVIAHGRLPAVSPDGRNVVFLTGRRFKGPIRV